MPPLLPYRFGDHDGFYHDPAEGLHESEGVGHYAQVRDGGRVVWPHDRDRCRQAGNLREHNSEERHVKLMLAGALTL